MKGVVEGTPVEVHTCGKRKVWVKREDLCCPDPGPAFSKIRGVYSHISQRPEDCIGVLDTYHSRGGWAVAYVCKQLGKACVLFYPQYASDNGLRPYQVIARRMGAAVRGLTAGRSAILYHTAKKLMPPGSYMMPNALKLTESVLETSEEVQRTTGMDRFKVVVVSISSATIAAGVLKGLARVRPDDPPLVILHMGYSRSEDQVRRYIQQRADFPDDCIALVDEGFQYRDRVDDLDVPFPCDPYYDRKAWRWLSTTELALPDPVLFWNVG